MQVTENANLIESEAADLVYVIAILTAEYFPNALTVQL